MPRPRSCRRIEGTPGAQIFRPGGRADVERDAVALSLEEYEAIRLADFEGLYQEEAAGRMAVSRQTFGRALESAHRKIARVLVEGLPLRIGDSDISAPRTFSPDFACPACGHAWRGGRGIELPAACPECGETGILRRPRSQHHRGRTP